MFKRVIAISILAACLAAGSFISAYAQEKSITSVSLSFSWDKSPRGGDIVGNIYASSSSSQYKVEGTVYVKDDDTWIFGECSIRNPTLNQMEVH